jgi:hypothetical protein
MAIDRTALRSSLQRMTSGQLTDSGDQDTYLNEAEREVLGDWRQFDPGLGRGDRTSDTTDASGILTVSAAFSRLERVEDGDKLKYELIDNLDRIWEKTGYYPMGYDQTSNVRQFKFYKNGEPLASAAVYYFPINVVEMGGAADAQSAVPNEFRDLIAMKAAHMYWRDQGPPFAAYKEMWRQEYEAKLTKAMDWYRNVSTDPQFVESYDPDAGG